MAVKYSLNRNGIHLTPAEEHRLRRLLSSFSRRLGHRPDPLVTLILSSQGSPREVGASLRVRLGPLGPTLVSRQAAETPDHATRLAVEALERQLERQTAGQRQEAAYGVPSRRRSA